ncbi:tetraspanin-19-like [Typha angustifolia]|uniref:tetraspanin-19-like n=1 Tax=Typha angustifolia TaxID=59011 RepID=UPI003C2FB2EE
MGRLVRSCLQSVLKLVNSVIGLTGLAMILYSLWMMRVWYKQFNGDPTPPWFIYSFLGLGVSVCLIAFSGHVAAETSNGHCLSCYMVFVFLLVMMEAAITADVFLNKYWEEDFPNDPTGRFDSFKNFVRSNFEMCKWIGLVIATAQILSILLAIVLKALGQDHGNFDDSDDDYTPARLPLLRNHVQPYYVEPHLSFNGSWNVNK